MAIDILRCLPLVTIYLLIPSRYLSFSYQHYQGGRRNHANLKRYVTALPITSDKQKISLELEVSVERRNFLHSISLVATMPTLININSAHAVPANNSSSTSNITNQQKVQSLLLSVPVFTIVDTEGVPFMVVGEDAKISCYFFTTFAEADRILSLARNSVDQSIKEKKMNDKGSQQGNGDDDEPFINPWREATISSVSLDFAVGLAKRGKVGGAGGAYFYIAPADKDVQEALALNPEVQELNEGKVPLFYIEDFTIEDQKASMKSPVYFSKEQLLKDWKKFHPKEKQDPPPIKVTELFAVLKLILSSTLVDDELQSIVFIPPTESIQKARECQARMGKSQAFQLGKRILIL